MRHNIQYTAQEKAVRKAAIKQMTRVGKAAKYKQYSGSRVEVEQPISAPIDRATKSRLEVAGFSAKFKISDR
jgi:hypothetical protein